MTISSPPSRRPAPPKAVAAPAGQQLEPLQLLPPADSAWPRGSLALSGAALAGFALAPAFGYGSYAPAVLVAGLLSAIAVATTGVRADQRRQLLDSLTIALGPALGWRPPQRVSVRASRWAKGWVGRPTKLRIRYSPLVDYTDPSWRPTLLAVAERCLLEPYRVGRHQPRRQRITLAVVTPLKETAVLASRDLLRAERTVAELLGSTARVSAQWDGDNLVALDVIHEAGTKVAAPGMRARVERTLSTMLPGRWRARWDVENDQVRFEIRPSLPKSVPHPVPVVTDENRMQLPYGVDEDGEILCWDMRTSASAPHALIAGKTGTGKTVLINGLVMEAAYRGWPVWLNDPKRIEFLGLRDWPNVQIVATTIPDQIAVIYKAHQEMERRYEAVENLEAVESDFEPLIFVLDEYRDFHGSATDWYAGVKVPGMPAKCPVFEKVAAIAQKGRSARIHLLVGTQRPDATFLHDGMRDNFESRVSLGRLSPQGALMMWETAYTGVAVPKRIPGRGTGVSYDGTPVESQAFWTPDPRRAAYDGNAEDLALLGLLKPAETTHGRLCVQYDEELMAETNDKYQPLGVWRAVISAELVAWEAADSDSAATSAAQEAQDRSTPHETTAAAALVLKKKAAATGTPAQAARGLRLVHPLAAFEEVEHLHEDEAAAGDFDKGDPDEFEFEGYGPAQEIRAARLRAGDLVLVDEAMQFWAAIESAEPDLDEGYVCIDWRGDDDEQGSLSLADEDLVMARRAVDEVLS